MSPWKSFPAAAEFRSNPRLRWGVWSIVAILWISGILALRDEVSREVVEHESLTRKVLRARQAATEERWLVRRDEARALSVALEDRLWREATLGLAQASFNDWLRSAISQSGISNAQVSIGAQSDAGTGAGSGAPGAAGEGGAAEPAGLWKVSARVAFDFRPASLGDLLARLGGSERSVVVESMRLGRGPNPRAELLLVAYFQRPADAMARDGGGRKGAG